MPENTQIVFKAMSFANGDIEFVNVLSKDFSENVMGIKDERLVN